MGDQVLQFPLFQFANYNLSSLRFCAVLITQSVSGFYKAFGQSFIADDHFLSFVGAVSSVFNCTGRLFYGILMDRFVNILINILMGRFVNVLINILMDRFVNIFILQF